MHTRLDNFNKLTDHPWYGRVISKLKKSDIELCISFIKETQDLDDDSFETAVNRMFLGSEKPKNFTAIMEVLSVSK